MIRRVCAVLLALFGLPFILTTGCSYDPPTACPETNPNCSSESDENSYVCSCSCSPAQRTRSVRVEAGDDDAEQFSGTVDIVSDDLDMNATRRVGVRFRGVAIPVGADVLSATVQFASLTSGTGPVTVSIAGEASANPVAFTTSANNLSLRPLTTNAVAWSPNDWPANALGSEQLTPDLEPVIQEIVDQAGWLEGNALVLIFTGTAGTGVRHATSFDTDAGRAAFLEVTYQEAASPVVGPQELPVCVPPDFNPNTGGTEPTADDLAADCSGRVADTLSGLAGACNYPSSCTCTAVADSRKFSGTCDDTCTPDEVDADCADFDPVAGSFGATNAPGDEAVCLANSPMSSGVFGRRTRCEVGGNATVKVEDHTAEPAAAGVVNFIGAACPGQSCAVAMEYLLDIDNVTFSNFWGSATFEDLAGLGDTTTGNEAVLDTAGVGFFGQQATDTSARGRKGSDRLAFVTTNNDVIDVEVLWGSVTPTCKVDGALAGAVDPEAKRCESFGPSADIFCETDDDCEDVDDCTDEVCNCETVGSVGMLVDLHVTGDIANQPPVADAGVAQEVECTNDSATNITLDGSASSDLDSNLTLFSWFRGTRTGDEVGIDQVSNIEQPLGSQTYVLRVIDGYAQADEDTTVVDVTDTTPPVVVCSTALTTLSKTTHIMTNVGLAATSEDVCEGTLGVGVHVFGDEDDLDDAGDGNFSPDAKNIDVGTLRLRQERNSAGNGRVYLIIADSTDTSGNRGYDCCTVTVPHTTSAASKASVAAQAAAAEQFCLGNNGTAPAGYVVVGDGPVAGPKQ